MDIFYKSSKYFKSVILDYPIIKIFCIVALQVGSHVRKIGRSPRALHKCLVNWQIIIKHKRPNLCYIFEKSMRFKNRTCIELRTVHVRGSSQVPPSSKSTTQPIRPQDCHRRPTFYQPSSFHFHPASSCSVLADHDQPLWSSVALSH